MHEFWTQAHWLTRLLTRLGWLLVKICTICWFVHSRWNHILRHTVRILAVTLCSKFQLMHCFRPNAANSNLYNFYVWTISQIPYTSAPELAGTKTLHVVVLVLNRKLLDLIPTSYYVLGIGLPASRGYLHSLHTLLG